MRTLSLNLRNAAPQELVNVICDTSGSMHGDAIESVRRGAARFRAQCSANPVLRERLQVQFTTFGGEVRIIPSTPIAMFQPPFLRAYGLTPLAEAVLAAIQATDQQIAILRNVAELETYTPLYFLSSDGAPTSSAECLQLAADTIREYERTERGYFYGFGVDDTAVAALQPLFVREVKCLDGVDFLNFFEIVSASVSYVSCRSVGEVRDLMPIIRGFLEAPHDDRND